MRAALPARCGGIQKEAVRQKRQITAQAQRAGATSGNLRESSGDTSEQA